MNNSNTSTREQSVGEEIANAISHGIGFAGAAAITPILIIQAISFGATAVVGASIFGSTMMLLYLASTLYHSFPPGFARVKQLFRIFDHGGIFLLIAGTYTPFTLTVLPAGWGWTLFGVVWGLAAIGLASKSISKIGTSRFSTALYLGMGWLAVIAAKPLWDNLPDWGIFWLLLGGFMYSAGVLFFVVDHKVRYSHFIWHLFVLAGTGCHVVAVMGFVYS